MTSSGELEWVLNAAIIELTTVKLLLHECLARLGMPIKLAVTGSKSETHTDSRQIATQPGHQSIKGTLNRCGELVDVSVTAQVSWEARPLRVQCQVPLVEVSLITTLLSHAERLLAPFVEHALASEVLRASSLCQQDLARVLEILDGAWHMNHDSSCQSVPAFEQSNTRVAVNITQEALLLRFFVFETSGKQKKLVFQESERSADPIMMTVATKIKSAINQLRRVEHKVHSCMVATI